MVGEKGCRPHSEDLTEIAVKDTRLVSEASKMAAILEQSVANRKRVGSNPARPSMPI